MSKYVAAVALMLAACHPNTHVVPQPVVGPLTCPILPASSGYLVQSKRGPDFFICRLKPIAPETPPAELYIGNFPANEEGLRFAGFTSSPIGSLAWFSVPRTADQPRRLVTYIPTQQDFPAVIKLAVEGTNSRKFAAQREELASLIVATRHAP